MQGNKSYVDNCTGWEPKEMLLDVGDLFHSPYKIVDTPDLHDVVDMVDYSIAGMIAE